MKDLLETDFVINYLTGQDFARDLFPTLLSAGAAISIITFSEFYEGLYGSYDPKAAEQGFLAFLKGVSILSVTRAVARRNARIRLDLRTRKRPITHRALDLLIAATALEHNLELITRNTDDYDDVAGISSPYTPVSRNANNCRPQHHQERTSCVAGLLMMTWFGVAVSLAPRG